MEILKITYFRNVSNIQLLIRQTIVYSASTLIF